MSSEQTCYTHPPFLITMSPENLISKPDAHMFAYIPIQGLSPYISYHYSLNFLSIAVLITFIYSIPCSLILFHLLFSHLTSKKLSGHSIFNAFVQMQLLVTLDGITDYLAVRIPTTGVFTQYCAQKDPQLVMKVVTFFYYGTSYASQLFTVMFCVMRVVILYCPVYIREKFESSFNICSFVALSISFACSIPQFTSDCVCLQMDDPFPFGAIVILSMFHYGNLIAFNFAYFLFTTLVMLVILISTYLMFRKLRERRKLSTIVKSSYSMKTERTLSVTMLLILVPLAFEQVVSIGEIFNHPLLSYLVIIRPVVDDWRTHLVTLYFYFTHPALKRKKVSQIRSTA